MYPIYSNISKFNRENDGYDGYGWIYPVEFAQIDAIETLVQELQKSLETPIFPWEKPW